MNIKQLIDVTLNTIFKLKLFAKILVKINYHFLVSENEELFSYLIVRGLMVEANHVKQNLVVHILIEINFKVVNKND